VVTVDVNLDHPDMGGPDGRLELDGMQPGSQKKGNIIHTSMKLLVTKNQLMMLG